MKVRDVMNVKPITCQVTDTAADAAKAMKENKISGMPVLDGERLVGVISESDLLRLLATEESGQPLASEPLRDLRGSAQRSYQMGEAAFQGRGYLQEKSLRGHEQEHP